MNEQTKQAIKIILEGASVLGALYKFWLSHGPEIKEIFGPLLQHCVELSSDGKVEVDN